MKWLSQTLHRWCAFNATQVELHERWLLRNRPWEEEYLHWSWDGEQWQLHGQLPPPPGRQRSLTTTGWCPQARTTQRQLP